MTRPAAPFPPFRPIGWLAALALAACRLRRRPPEQLRLAPSTTAIPSRRTIRSTASTSPNTRGRSTGTRSRAAASSSPGSRRPRAATISTSVSRPTGRAPSMAGIPHGAYHFVYWCRHADRGGDLVRTERAGRGRRAAAGARRRADAGLEDLPAPSRTRPDDRRHEGDARRDGAPFRQAADHLHLDRLLPRHPLRRRLRRLSDLGALDQAQSRPCPTASRPGSSGNTRPTARVPGIDGHVDRNAFYGTPEQWQAFSTGRRKRATRGSRTSRRPPQARRRRAHSPRTPPPLPRPSTPRAKPLRISRLTRRQSAVRARPRPCRSGALGRQSV